MRKWSYRLSLIVAGLFITYWLSVKAVFLWLQYDPDRLFTFIDTVAGVEIAVEQMSVSQTWSTANIELKNVEIISPEWSLEMKLLQTDVNFFSVWLPKMRYGQSFTVDGAELTLQPSFEEPEEPFNFSQFDLHGKTSFVRRLWKIIRISDLSILFNRQDQLKLHLNLLQSYFGLKWSFGGLSSISVQGEKVTDFQFKGDFLTNVWNWPEEGEATFDIVNPLNLDLLYGALPSVWEEQLPIGELVGDAKLIVKDGKLDYLRVYSRVQDLFWPKKDALLPKSIALGLNIKHEQAPQNSSTGVWNIELEKIRLDNDFIKAVSPIYLTYSTNYELAFRTKQFELDAVQPLFELLLSELDYQSMGAALKDLKLHEVSGLVDLKQASLSQLHFNIPSINIEETKKLPGILVQNLTFDKTEKNISVKLPNPVVMRYQVIKKEPISIQFAKEVLLTINSSKSIWKLPQTDFLINGMPFTLQAESKDSKEVELFMTSELGTLENLKGYLPYGIMGEPLRNWLQSALVAGDGISADAYLKGDLSKFPFEKGQGVFKATARVHHAELNFQPDWPAVKNFSAKLEFTPYRLTVSAPEAVLENIKVRNIEVNINDLNTKNIAVAIKGKAQGKADDAITFLNATPLTKKLQLDQFLNDKVKASGEVEVDLAKIWVPVYGYRDKDETVKGQASFKNAQVSLLDFFHFSNLTGVVNFTESSVSTSEPLQVVYENGPAQVVINTNNEIVSVFGKGEAQFDNDEMTGKSKWQSEVNIPLVKEKNMSIHMSASLENLNSHLPEPLNKLYSDSIEKDLKKVDVQVGFDSSLIHFRGKISDIAQFRIDWSEADKRPENAKVSIGKTDSFSNLPQEKGFAVNGRFDRVDLDGWLKLLNQHGLFEGASDEPVEWLSSFVETKQVVYSNQLFNNVIFNWDMLDQEQERLLAFNLKGDEISLVGTQNKKGEYVVSLDKLIWQIEEKQDKKVEECEVNQSVYPPVIFTGTNIKIGDRLINKAQFRVEDSADSMSLKDIKIEFGKVNGELTGNYVFQKSQDSSNLRVTMKTKKVEDLTAFIGIKEGFTGKQGAIHANVQWAGGLGCYSLLALNGKSDFEFKDGVIQDADPGIARVLGLLSFESLARRLKLDLKDITDKGLAYNSIKGKGTIENGIYHLNDLTLKAPAASAYVSGKIDLKQETLDLVADITPAIGSTLPAVAIISGFATPIAGLATYALLKAVPLVNEDLVTYRYKVSGTFDDPVLKDKGVRLEVIRQNKAAPDPSEDLLNIAP